MIAAPRTAERAAAMCGAGVEVVELPIDDSWFRDSGPIYVVDDGGARVATDWRFNAWGDKFLPFDDDALAARRFADIAGDPVRSVDMVFEGGSITGDGEGTIVTTDPVPDAPQPQPDDDPGRTSRPCCAPSSACRAARSGCPTGWRSTTTPTATSTTSPRSPTPGHLVLQGCDDTRRGRLVAPRRRPSRRRGCGRCRAGAPLEVTVIPVLPFAEVDGERVVVPVPQLLRRQRVRRRADVRPSPPTPTWSAMIGDLYPGRETFALDVGATLAYGGGGIHCITQQIPAP